MAGSHAAPPETLDRDLDVGPEDFQERHFYQLMTGMVIPRPIGWISTISENGVATPAVVESSRAANRNVRRKARLSPSSNSANENIAPTEPNGWSAANAGPAARHNSPPIR